MNRNEMNKKSATDPNTSGFQGDNQMTKESFDLTGTEFGCTELLAILEASSEDLRSRKEKFHLKSFGMENIFLPSLEHGIDFVLGMSFKQILKAAEKSSGRALPMSRSSWFDIFNRGVGYPTMKKFFHWLRPASSAFSSKCDALSLSMLNKGIRASSSGGNWLCFISGLRASDAYQQHAFASEYQPQFDFIFQRCNAELEMVSQIRGLIDNGEVAKQDAAGIMRLMQPYWQKYSLVPKEELQAYEEALILRASGKLVDEEPIAALLRAYCFLNLDFYLNLFASYEVGCVLTYRSDRSDLASRKGLLCRALSRHSLNVNNDSKISTCFGELLEEIRGVLSGSFGELTVREMARHIPLKNDPSNPSAETDSDRCYNTLKAWKKGKEVPSRELLEQFFSNLTDKIGHGHNEPLILMCNMAIGLDKMRNTWIQQLSTAQEIKNIAPLIGVFSEVIGRYGIYYQHHLQLQLNKE